MDADPYADPKTGVLYNKHGIDDAARLARVEADQTRFRIEQLREAPIKGSFDLAHLQAIHRRIFQDVYAWAGELRTVSMSKNDDVFAMPGHIEGAAGKLFRQLAGEQRLGGLTRAPFADRAAYYLTEINALHPFREGNGRAQRVFMEQLGREAGHTMDFTRISREAMILGSRLSFNAGPSHMQPLVESALRAGRELEHGQGRER